mmetsp:Transcript_17191/g.15073  ORF Transcript_17191/g.15073 Transcript_17191/m.15073 type:complete len:208 (+) Transcript_17191:497-1120(+)
MNEISFSKSITPNEITYNTLIDACTRAGDMDLAFKYFTEMKEKQLQPDNFTYSTIIKGIKNHHTTLQKEQREFTNAKVKNGKLFNNHYATLEKVLEILDTCKEGKIVKPDEILFNCVMDACIKFKNMKKALEIYHEMIEMGLTPSSITYGILIKGYGLEKKFDGVMYMYDKMCENNIRLNDVTYGCLIDACIKCDKPEKALQFFKML